MKTAFDKESLLKKLGLTAANYKLINFLVNNEDDYHDFIKNYWNGEASQFFAVADYRLHKIEEANLSFADFMEMIYKGDPRTALESLFQHPVYQCDVERLFGKMANKELTINDVYEAHKKNKEIMLMSLLT